MEGRNGEGETEVGIKRDREKGEGEGQAKTGRQHFGAMHNTVRSSAGQPSRDQSSPN